MSSSPESSNYMSSTAAMGETKFISKQTKDLFHRKRELCELFKLKNKEFSITFNINSKKVTIFVRHFWDWDSQGGKIILTNSGETLNYH